MKPNHNTIRRITKSDILKQAQCNDMVYCIANMPTLSTEACSYSCTMSHKLQMPHTRLYLWPLFCNFIVLLMDFQSVLPPPHCNLRTLHPHSLYNANLDNKMYDINSTFFRHAHNTELNINWQIRQITSITTRPVSYTHLTLPTNREV